MEKYCGGCKKTLNINLFSKNQNQCRECKKRLHIKFKENNVEKYKIQMKECNQRKKHKIKNSLKKCEQCFNIKFGKEFNYPYNDTVKICRDCTQNNEILRIKNLKFITCPKCKEELSISCFAKNKTKKIGYSSLCKACFKVINKNFRINNREKYNESNRKYYYKTRIKCVLRSRIRMALLYSSAVKTKKTFEYMQCTLEECKKWLEYQFNSNMSWENYGEYWHIDHVIPCAFFDLRNDDEAKICFNWKNIRPLEANENIVKKDKIDINEIFNHYNIIIKYIKHYM